MDRRAEDYKQEDDLEHARNRTAMYLGGKLPVKTEEYLLASDETIGLYKVSWSPAALKCFDEILVNAIDQNTKTKGGCNIWININPHSGGISVKNDGSCIPVVRKETKDGRMLWLPQFLFCEFRTSGNFNKESEDRITGGTFGFGATLVNAFSKRFIIETLDPVSKQYYSQEIENCLSEVHEPEIEKADDDEKPYTKISMLLNYEDFKMNDNKDLMNTFYKLLYMRALQTAVFIAPKKVHWNDKLIEIQLPRQLLTMHLRPKFSSVDAIKIVEFQLANKKLIWRLAVGVQPPDGFEHLLIANGIYVRNGGSPVEHIADQIVEYCKDKYMALVKKLTKNKTLKFTRLLILKYLMIMMAIQVNKPSFTGQRKDQIDTPTEEYADVIIPKDYLEWIWKHVAQFVDMDLMDKAAPVEKSKTRKKVKAKKYTPAAWAGGDKSAQCSLFIAEGDSAVGTLDRLITTPVSQVNKMQYGIFSIQGVPVNARKEIEMKKDPRTGTQIKMRSKKLLENERLNSLITVLGLDRSKTYESRREMDELRYGCVIIATDQDEDGKGNIRSQIMNFFQIEWPWLLKNGYVKFLITPLVRAYHKKGLETVKEFFTEKDYHAWKHSVNESEYEIVYYKGLGSHSNDEIDNMAKKVLSMIITAKSTPAAEERFDVYFGPDADKRKVELRTPVEGTEEQYYKDGTIDVTDHLRTETKSFQLYNVSRHIPHDIDGMLITARKVVCGSRKKFIKNNRCKVYQLSGFMTEKVNYHHGDMSANSVIIGMAQCYPCSNELPLLRALSNFGSRKKGGTDAGQPRYIYTKRNKPLCDALNPLQDDYLLDWTFDDGRRGEPKRYIPIVPLGILESYKSPGTGWATTIWARDFDEVYTWVVESVTLGHPAERKEDFSPSASGTKHQLRVIKGVPYSLGTYKKVGADSLIVTELPLRKWNEHLVKGNPDAPLKLKAAKAKKEVKSKAWEDDPNIVDVFDASDADKKVEIHVTFAKGFLTQLESKKDTIDPVLKYLGLTQSLKSALNFVGMDGAVAEYSKYIDIARVWFGERKKLYLKRMEREEILLKLKLLCLKQKLTFAMNRHSYKLNDKKKVDQQLILKEEKFQTIDQGLLDKPQYTDVHRLEELILKGPNSNWDYLLKMTSLAMNVEGIEKLKKQIADLEAQLQALKDTKEVFPGQNQWLSELKNLREVVTKGKRQGWEAWDVKPKWGA